MPDARPATTPAGRLRRIAAIVADADLAAGDARVLVAVVAHANGRGRAWPGQRRLRRAACACGSTVARALRRAVERGHLIPAGRGPHGVTVWIVPDVVPDDPPDDGAAYRATGALNTAPSVPCDGRADGRASVPSASAPAYPLGDSSVPSHRRETMKINREEKEEARTAPSAQARTTRDDDADGNGNGPDTDARFLSVYAVARGRPCRNGEAAKLAQAVAEARAAGATDALIANAILDAADAAPWAGANAARGDARELVRDWDRHIEQPRPTVQAILDDLAFVRQYLARPPSERENAGTIRCESVRAWAERYADVLAKARAWPDAALHARHHGSPATTRV